MNMASLTEIKKNPKIPDLAPGDTVRVSSKIVEGDKERIQVFEGIVIGFHRNGVATTFKVRKESYGVGVERTYPMHSPLLEKIEAFRPRTTKLNKEFGNVVIDKVNIGQCIGGARDVRCLVTDISYLDPFEGIRFRGKTIPETFDALKAFVVPGCEMPTVESFFYFLLTGDVPTKEQAEEVKAEWKSREAVPQYSTTCSAPCPATTSPPSSRSCSWSCSPRPCWARPSPAPAISCLATPPTARRPSSSRAISVIRSIAPSSNRRRIPCRFSKSLSNSSTCRFTSTTSSQTVLTSYPFSITR
jgi:ribosomal protein L19